MFSPVELALAALLVGAAQIAKVDAHMVRLRPARFWPHPSVYGIGPDWTFPAGELFDPLGPGVADQDDWWFRGPATRALAPQNGSVMELPAGGSVDIEIACNYAFSSYGPATSDPNDPLSACPSGAGPYHSGNPNASVPDPTFISGCALGIADKDDIENVGWDDLAIFSVNHNCVAQRITTFEIPARMPSCTGDKCICGWFWLANNGTANFYMTAFDCAITNVDPTLAAPILPVVDPVWCAPGNTTCQPAAGAKRPLYAYNTPTNVVWEGNNDRPGYHAEWSFPNDGAQNDIFDLSGVASTGTADAALPATSAGSTDIPVSTNPATTAPAPSPSAPGSAGWPRHHWSGRPHWSLGWNASDTAASLSANPLGRRTAAAASAGPKQHSSLAGAAVGLVGAVVAAMLVIA
ncbi:hypothetical protein JCM21900_005710 [Sporobolomyces salmonicolor]